MSILHQQLLECIREVESIRQCKDLASQLTIRLEEEEQHLKKWEARIPKEQRDVDILEGEGITSLITKFIGNRENKIEEEKDEYLRASRHYMDIYNSIELLRFELDILKKKEETLKIVENRLVSLMKEREKELILSDPKIAELINKINNDSNLLMTPIKNIGNLIKSGEEIIDNLVIIGQNLIEASGYYLNKDKDYWPLMYDALGNARQLTSETSQKLKKFQKELASKFNDIQFNPNIQFEKFGLPTGSIIEDMISDVLIGQKIKTTLESVGDMMQKLSIVLGFLQPRYDELMTKMAALEVERNRLVVESK